MQRRLESGVADLHGVRSVSANIRTGRVLITYHPDTLLEDLVDLVEKLLAGCRQASPSPAPAVLVLGGPTAARKTAASLAVAEALRAMGPETVIVKRGEYGALLFLEEDIFCAPAYPLKSVAESTGVGDGFAGGFLGYLADGGYGDLR